MKTRARESVQQAMKNFYYEHHDKIKFEDELVLALDQTRIRTFSDTKHRTITALDGMIEGLRRFKDECSTSDAVATGRWSDANAKMAALEKFRTYLKGMVIQVDEEL